MKRLILILGLIVGMVAVLPAQDNKSKREQRKQEKEQKLMAQFEETKHILENKLFILEANRIIGRYGNSVEVSPMINFIGIDSSNAVIQTGNPQRIGYNALGGVTAKGSISNYELDINEKKKTFKISMNVHTPVGLIDIQMTVGTSGYADATLYGIRGKGISYYGEIVPMGQSIAYEGLETYF